MREYNTKKPNSWEKSGIKPKNIPKENRKIKFITAIALSNDARIVYAASWDNNIHR
jgi:hypothetical protein